MGMEKGHSETRERNMWIAIFGFSILAGIAAALYLAGKIEKTGIFSFINNAAVRKVSAVLSVVIVGIILWKTLNMTNTIVVAVHVAVRHRRMHCLSDYRMDTHAWHVGDRLQCIYG